jgi:hypothetical protein
VRGRRHSYGRGQGSLHKPIASWAIQCYPSSVSSRREFDLM